MIALLVILLIPSFSTQQLNTSYLLKDLKAQSKLPYNNKKALPAFYLLLCSSIFETTFRLDFNPFLDFPGNISIKITW